MEQKVLVVEDEPTLLDTPEYNLTRQGYAVCTAANGPTALPLTRSFDCAQDAPPARWLVRSRDASYNITSRGRPGGAGRSRQQAKRSHSRGQAGQGTGQGPGRRPHRHRRPTR